MMASFVASTSLTLLLFLMFSYMKDVRQIALVDV
uniref:Uncharacterized protein n=1 Tax=Arundo donax TaxID=35708 RepID=A0A0A9G2I5_ARUDO